MDKLSRKLLAGALVIAYTLSAIMLAPDQVRSVPGLVYSVSVKDEYERVSVVRFFAERGACIVEVHDYEGHLHLYLYILSSRARSRGMKYRQIEDPGDALSDKELRRHILQFVGEKCLPEIIRSFVVI